MTRSIDDLVSAVAVMLRLGSELGDIGPTLQTVHKTMAGVLNTELLMHYILLKIKSLQFAAWDSNFASIEQRLAKKLFGKSALYKVRTLQERPVSHTFRTFQQSTTAKIRFIKI